MDPDACLRLLQEAVKAGEPFARHLDDLYRWINRGGFEPDWTKHPEAAHEYRLAYKGEFVEQYIVSALWSTIEETGDHEHPRYDTPLEDNYSAEDLAPETLIQMIADCKKFQEDNKEDLDGYTTTQAAHDFWLTRNRHGCGFWENDFGDPDANARMTEYCHKMGEVYLEVGDDGKIYC